MPRLALIAAAAVLGLCSCVPEQPITLPEDGEIYGNDAGQVVRVESGDLYYEGMPSTLAPGVIRIRLENSGALAHDITIEELRDRTVVRAAPGETAAGTVTLDPGTYTFYCSVPGHRAEMTHTVTVR